MIKAHPSRDAPIAGAGISSSEAALTRPWEAEYQYLHMI